MQKKYYSFAPERTLKHYHCMIQQIDLIWIAGENIIDTPVFPFLNDHAIKPRLINNDNSNKHYPV
ncbi:Uncharacterised protein [Candidatus Venteria ishoeyi]|uniref:Uncharacterized protein n=1 Tax=Candidatus Venteria ishoeyi TaxID=1899563 RepID=A0A1H6F4M7_9GAMM|nr:Uncharacterised protein [Candidatus Venteria ishoeyi]